MNDSSPYVSTQTNPQQSKGLSITSLVLGILSLFFLGFLAAIPGIIVGHIARSKAKHHPQQYAGGGMALAGLIISYAVIIVTLILFYVVATNPDIQEAIQQALEQAKQKAQ